MFPVLINAVKKTIFLCFCGFLFSINTFAQISLSFPVNRVVIQRNNDNIGFINVLGNYYEHIDKVEARLIPVADGQGTAVDWMTVQDNPRGGYFHGRITALGGWYKMEIRALRSGQIIHTIEVEKVGIGEVFIALGQSNAEGLPDSGAFGATDDRVNAINYRNDDILDPLPENLNFVHLDAHVNIAPSGSTAWCYGELGDRIAQKLNVPVLFFNVGLLSVSVINWRESAEGIPTIPFNHTSPIPKGLPYTNLRNTLHYYGALLGVRSMLWIQGETDNSPYRLSADVYSSNLQRFIDITRSQFNNDLSWVVARTSLTYLSPSNPEIIRGQNIVIERPGNNVFPGPFTDDLQIPRPDHVHFKNVGPGNNGLSILAENWDKHLDDNFFRNSRPVMSKLIVDPHLTCDPNNQTILTLPDNLASYNWSNGGHTNQIIVDKGVYAAKVRDHQGNQLMVPTVNTHFLYPNSRPVISYEGNMEFCVNEQSRINLTANGGEFNSFLWSTGDQSHEINVDHNGTFSVKGLNGYGCASENADAVSVKINPAPEKPFIAVSPSASVCDGDSISLHVESIDHLLWNNDSTTAHLSVKSTGTYWFAVKATNDFGCAEHSDSLLVRINSIPVKPTINISTDSVVCEGAIIRLSTDSPENLLWNNNSTDREIMVDKVGEYAFQVKATTEYGCEMLSDSQRVFIKAAPQAPGIEKVGIYTLQALNVIPDETEHFQWIRDNVKLSTTQTPAIKATQEGAYQVSTVRYYPFGDNRTLSCESIRSGVANMHFADDELTLYPNPATEILYLEAKTTLRNVSLRFYNYAGKLAYIFNINDTSERKGIDLRKVENGAYLIKIKSTDYEKTDRIIISNK